MAVKDTTKFLQSMMDFVAKEYKRGAIDKFPTVVTFTAIKSSYTDPEHV